MLRVMEHCLSMDVPEKEALATVTETFDSVPLGRGKKRAMKKMDQAFKAKLAELGIGLNGPPKNNSATPKKRGASLT